jgi:hypothetical protein
MATLELNNITDNKDEAPAEFAEAFKQIKEAANDGVQVDTGEQKRGRGRPRKVKDEADARPAGQVDDADNITPAAEPAKEDVTAEPEEGIASTVQPTEEFIPDNWVEAGRKAGMSDNTIQAIASENPTLLKQLAGDVAQPAPAAPQPAAQPQQPAPRQQISDDIFKPIELKLDPEVHGDEVSKAVDALVNRLNEQTSVMKQLRDQNTSFENERQVNQVRATQEQFDSLCDSLVKELPAVGDRTKKLNAENLATRETIWKKAFAMSGGQPPTQETWDDALAWYRGKHGTAFIKQQVVTQLKNRAGKLTYRPTHKQAIAEPKDGGGITQFEKEHARIRAKYEA